MQILEIHEAGDVQDLLLRSRLELEKDGERLLVSAEGGESQNTRTFRCERIDCEEVRSADRFEQYQMIGYRRASAPRESIDLE